MYWLYRFTVFNLYEYSVNIPKVEPRPIVKKKHEYGTMSRPIVQKWKEEKKNRNMVPCLGRDSKTRCVKSARTSDCAATQFPCLRTEYRCILFRTSHAKAKKGDNHK